MSTTKKRKRPDLVARNKSLWMRKKVRESKLGKKRPDISGANNHRWKGGIMQHHGYVTIFMPNHPFANKHGYVNEHRLVMEKYLGRYLKPTEVVHHKDSNPKNNLLENLHLFSSMSDHMKHHHPKGINPNLPRAKRDPVTGRYLPKI